MTESRWVRPILVFAALGLAGAVAANPWVAPGDEALRSDIQRLADAGIIRGPVTTWPLSWPDIARDVLEAGDAGLSPSTASSLWRIKRRAREASLLGFDGGGFRVAGSHDVQPIRGFAESPREEAEVALRAGWLSEHFAANLQGAYAADPSDAKAFRADGSYLGVNVGNFMISAGLMERWWGPGWDGSLILSTNARPIPSVTLERNYTDPFKVRLLSWLGPWRASVAVGEAESHDVAVADVRFMAARVNFKPRPWLEFGLTRTAQWCGGGRDCGFETMIDMLLGRDNETEDGDPSPDQPGNQMAGYDFRIRSPWLRLPLAVYSQWIGEDEAGGLPSKFIGLMGMEVWGDSPVGGWRVRAEYADTACNFSRDSPQFDCAYRNSIYPQGYTYRGRAIGHGMDNDGRVTSVAALLSLEGGDLLSLSGRRMELNRNGGTHTITTVPLDAHNVELRYSRPLGSSTIQVGMEYGDVPRGPAQSSRLSGFVIWQQGF